MTFDKLKQTYHTIVGSHHYVSTACLHGHHKECRLGCKFCGVACQCTLCNHAAEASGNVPETSKETSSGEGGSSPTPSLHVPAIDIQKLANLLELLSQTSNPTPLQRSVAHTAAIVLEGYLKENATT